MIVFTAGSGAQTVTVEKWGDRKEEHFDPAHPPEDLPLLAQKEVALASARPWVEWKGEPSRGMWDRRSHSLTIDGVGAVTLTGHTDLMLPQNATAALRAHEMGHDRVNAIEWDRSALQVVIDALKDLKGTKFNGEGADDEARRTSAWKKADAEYARRMTAAVAEIHRRMDQAGEQFDAATDHGRSEKVDSDQAVEKMLKESPTTRAAGGHR